MEWIDKFPEDKAIIYANDFGFTTDPNVLGKYAEDEYNIWIEPLTYEPIENAKALASLLDELGIKKNSDRYSEDGDLIVCDSADKYTGENKGTVEMVKGLADLLFRAKKISKTKSVMHWLNSMKTKKIHIVKNHLYQKVLKEQQNYRMKEIGGIAVNQPIDQFNHFWDMARYGHIAHNSKTQIFTTSDEAIQNVNY